ncbi:MAG: MFS transporter [Hyphomonas sp. 34-62-18]|nr:MAG: MFS transporter [Hyphomonas sp. 34-62-18]
MLSVLSNRTYRHLFLAQLVALLGTGLLTVALGLLAYDISGADAGQVLGTALAIKMVAYIGIAPIAGAFVNVLPRRTLLVLLDLVRALVALSLPFVTEVWQIYFLVFLLQSASAAFTPAFQATIPDILPDEKDYTRALSLSRLAYDMESLLSPLFAAMLLTVISFNGLFAGTAAGFLGSALLVVSVRLPALQVAASTAGGLLSRTTRGIRTYIATPRLVGLLAVTLSAAAASAMVIVNTIVIVREDLALGQTMYALALGAYGLGSMLAAFALTPMLERLSERSLMIGASMMLSIFLLGLALAGSGFGLSLPLLAAGWFLLGSAYSLCVTPSGRLLRKSGPSEERPSLFAAQFALSHACWLVAYPLAGWLGSAFGQNAALAGMGLLSLVGFLLALCLWPAADDERAPHSHENLPNDHPHIIADHRSGSPDHIFHIDELHKKWPKPK